MASFFNVYGKASSFQRVGRDVLRLLAFLFSPRMRYVKSELTGLVYQNEEEGGTCLSIFLSWLIADDGYFFSPKQRESTLILFLCIGAACFAVGTLSLFLMPNRGARVIKRKMLSDEPFSVYFNYRNS